jgi:hypothetical protein
MPRALALPAHVAVATKVSDRLELKRMAYSENIYLGDCPLCGSKNAFFMWLHKACFHCYTCGADGLFGRTPESTLATLAEAMKKEGL